MKYDEATKTAVYIRVSSSSQDETIQIESAERWLALNGISKENVIYYNEHSLSANKVKMSNRPQLMALRRDVRAGIIKRILVFTRCCFTRNFFEHIDIVEELYLYKVEVIFTNRETPPFSSDFLTEGIQGIQVQSEGSNIKKRLKDVHDFYPPQKFGFEKKNRKYGINQAFGFEIQSLFNTVSRVKGEEELISLINNYKKSLGRNTVEDVWKMLRTPFYAAHYEKDGFYFELSHVEPIVSINIFKEVQAILDQYEESFINALIKSCNKSLIEPYCGICGKGLPHKKNSLGKSAYYYCSKHNIKIFVNDLDENIRNSMKEVVV